MIFANVKSITIPEGNVKQISSGGVVLWKMVEESGPTYTNLVTSALAKDGTILDGIGYRQGAYYNGSTITSASAFTSVGFISIDGSVQHDIYLYGLSLSGTPKNVFVLGTETFSAADHFGSLKDGFSNTNIESITKLADNYYKIRTNTYSTRVKYFALSGVTVSGLVPIVTIDEPIF